jgi:hypothetical protein
LYAVGVPWALRRCCSVTFHARWVAQFGSNPPSVVSGSCAWVSARPYGLSGPIGDCTVSVATTGVRLAVDVHVEAGDDEVLVDRRVGAGVDDRARSPGGSPRNGVVTMIPVARTLRISIVPSS